MASAELTVGMLDAWTEGLEAVLAGHHVAATLSLWCFAGIGAMAVLRILWYFVPRIRIELFDEPIQGCVLSAATNNVEEKLAGTLTARLGDKGTIQLSANEDEVENVIIIVGADVSASTQLIRGAIDVNRINNVVIVDVVCHHRDPEAPEASQEDAFARLCERGRHLYYRRLVDGLQSEYAVARIRLATVESFLVNDSAALDELLEYVVAEATDSRMKLTKSEMVRPKVYRLHVALILLAFAFAMIFSMPWVSFMDPVTMRPRKGFDPTLKALAVATNTPIKLGIVHGILYMLEYFIDPELFKRHVGQRITTLWYQLFQFARFGQHLQMHVETLVQLADAMYSPRMYRRKFIRAFLWVVIVGVLTQDALTSLAWHSFTEQTIGFCLGAIKLICFDWAARGANINRGVGESLSRWIQWVGGALSLSGGLVMNDFAPLNPTTMATLMVVGGAATLLVLLRYKGIPLHRFNDL